jgi:hypothetical protein
MASTESVAILVDEPPPSVPLSPVPLSPVPLLLLIPQPITTFSTKQGRSTIELTPTEKYIMDSKNFQHFIATNRLTHDDICELKTHRRKLKNRIYQRKSRERRFLQKIHRNFEAAAAADDMYEDNDGNFETVDIMQTHSCEIINAAYLLMKIKDYNPN